MRVCVYVSLNIHKLTISVVNTEKWIELQNITKLVSFTCNKMTILLLFLKFYSYPEFAVTAALSFK